MAIQKGVVPMNLDMNKIGTYIQLQRKLAGLTQMQLGERLHVTA